MCLWLHPSKSILFLTHHLGIRLCLMAPSRSIMTTSYALESLNSLMEFVVASPLIPLTRITNKEPTKHSLLHRGSFISLISSMSSCRRWFTFLCGRSLFIYLYTQNTQVSETKEFRRSFQYNCTLKHELKTVSTSVLSYRGALIMPKWKDVDPRKSFV